MCKNKTETVQDMHPFYWCLQISADLIVIQQAVCLSEVWRLGCVCRDGAAMYKHKPESSTASDDVSLVKIGDCSQNVISS